MAFFKVELFALFLTLRTKRPRRPEPVLLGDVVPMLLGSGESASTLNIRRYSASSALRSTFGFFTPSRGDSNPVSPPRRADQEVLAHVIAIARYL